jgi:hypothetical protein
VSLHRSSPEAVAFLRRCFEVVEWADDDDDGQSPTSSPF